MKRLLIDISDTEYKWYNEWVETTQNMDISEYIPTLMRNKLEELKRESGRCIPKSIRMKKGEFKGSCVWSSRDNSYKVCVRKEDDSKMCYGFFSDLYHAERELERLFKNDEESIWDEGKRKQQYYQIENRNTTRPRLTDSTYDIADMYNKKGGVVFVFKESFVNPITLKKQKQITWSKGWFKYYNKKGIIDECLDIDDPVEIIRYRDDLKKRLDKMLDEHGE